MKYITRESKMQQAKSQFYWTEICMEVKSENCLSTYINPLLPQWVCGTGGRSGTRLKGCLCALEWSAEEETAVRFPAGCLCCAGRLQDCLVSPDLCLPSPLCLIEWTINQPTRQTAVYRHCLLCLVRKDFSVALPSFQQSRGSEKPTWRGPRFCWEL